MPLPPNCRAVLLDFDGPVCSVFAGFRASDVAKALYRKALSAGITVDPELVSDDPMQLLHAGVTPGDLKQLDGLLTDLEVEAIQSASPTPGADEVVRRLLDSGLYVSVVSNNSKRCIDHYWHDRDLPVVPLIGRPEGQPNLMKPSPYLLEVACENLGVSPSDVVFVGDSVSDIEAARRFGCVSLGYANKPGKSERLSAAGADEVVADMHSVTHLLLSRSE